MGFKNTEVGRIPNHWDVLKIENIGCVVGGGTPRKSVNDYWNGTIPWITPKDLSNYNRRYISHGDRNITQEGLDNSATKLLPKGTVLFSSRAPIGYLAIAEKEVCTNQGFKSIICDKSKIDNTFLYYLMKLKKTSLENIANGSTFKEVSGRTVKDFKIPVPPINEQKSISEVLSSLDDKIETNNVSVK
ncbi:restriction endonuclease subunit S [Sporolactobacillus sp. THM7-7]|nr:restriction endonuclease subunit S [Sporolactobacillus sp. THM7-7]